jgi:hypothetical protein
MVRVLEYALKSPEVFVPRTRNEYDALPVRLMTLKVVVEEVPI